MSKGAVVPQRVPRKPKLGQHFLVDQQARRSIVEALGDVSQLTVIEIGPGRGALTDLLATRAGHLVAVECDRLLSAQLRMKFTRLPHVEIIEADILTVDIRTMIGNRRGPLRDLRPSEQPKARVVGNLPYYITSDILLRLLTERDYFDRIVIMVQLEVADRLAAVPGTRDYGLLSATAQLSGRVEKLFTLPPGAFSPPPEVDSAVLRIDIAPRFAELQVDEHGFIEFLKRSFAQKRKMLSSNLRQHFNPAVLRKALPAAGIEPGARAETVPLEQMAALYRELKGSENRE
ncbi:MAG: 16S rRNA (adenine(1518)-N(6)/adenine(1519)-N(6))-dimethyltransferase RsmA [Candidatus Korobacteraceae bacterium]|jgi:16S rRNA (adenine1518-N6/adenine1519-N6)-dimethyltransferase